MTRKSAASRRAQAGYTAPPTISLALIQSRMRVRRHLGYRDPIPPVVLNPTLLRDLAFWGSQFLRNPDGSPPLRMHGLILTHDYRRTTDLAHRLAEIYHHEWPHPWHREGYNRLITDWSTILILHEGASADSLVAIELDWWAYDPFG